MDLTSWDSLEFPNTVWKHSYKTWIFSDLSFIIYYSLGQIRIRNSDKYRHNYFFLILTVITVPYLVPHPIVAVMIIVALFAFYNFLL